MKAILTDKHEYLRGAHQAANDFKYGYVTISNSTLGTLLAERDSLREALVMAEAVLCKQENELRSFGAHEPM